MRFHLDDARRHRRVTKALPRLMREGGVDIGHTGAADVAARLFGYADRHELDACLGRMPASRWDEDEAATVVAARRSRQVDVLVRAGVAPAAAAGLVDRLGPTARRAPSRLPPATPIQVPSAPSPARPSVTLGGLDAILDAWDVGGSADLPGLLSQLVRQAYDEGFDRLSVALQSRGSLYHAIGSHYEDTRPLLKGPDHVGERLIKWIGAVGAVHEVRHGDILIPFVVEKASPHHFSGFLRVSKRVSAPPIEAYGIERQAEWLAALAGRPGLHVMCCPKGFSAYPRYGFGSLAETLSIVMEDSPVGILSRMSGPMALDICRSEVLAEGSRASPPSGRLPGPETAIYLMVLSEFGSSPETLREIVDLGSSVLWLVSGTLEEVMATLLAEGIPSAWLRSNLVSVALRTDPPVPYAPSVRLGRGECEPMHWSVDMRRAVP